MVACFYLNLWSSSEQLRAFKRRTQKDESPWPAPANQEDAPAVSAASQAVNTFNNVTSVSAPTQAANPFSNVASGPIAGVPQTGFNFGTPAAPQPAFNFGSPVAPQTAFVSSLAPGTFNNVGAAASANTPASVNGGSKKRRFEMGEETDEMMRS
jgi:hypothetical protein